MTEEYGGEFVAAFRALRACTGSSANTQRKQRIRLSGDGAHLAQLCGGALGFIGSGILANDIAQLPDGSGFLAQLGKA